MNEAELRKHRARASMRKYRYGITDEYYQALLEAQDSKCAVCKTDFTEKVKPHVDHNHNCCAGTRSCGKCLRGLLCSHCITTASLVETRFGHMEDMFRYLHFYLVNGKEE